LEKIGRREINWKRKSCETRRGKKPGFVKKREVKESSSSHNWQDKKQEFKRRGAGRTAPNKSHREKCK